MRIQEFRTILLSSLIVIGTAAIIVFALKLYTGPKPVGEYLSQNITQTLSPWLSKKFNRTPYDEDTKGNQNLDRILGTRSNAPRPNIILILAHGLGYGDLGCYGNTVVKTPHINDLAAQGAIFTRFYTANAVDVPSRAALLTGRYAHRTGVTYTLYPDTDPHTIRRAMRNMEKAFTRMGAMDHPRDLSILKGLPPSEISVARGLKKAGYHTALFGKWDLGDFNEDENFHPLAHGFDWFNGFNPGFGDWPVTHWENKTPLEKDIRRGNMPSTTYFFKKARAFIQSPNKTPFFIMISPPGPRDILQKRPPTLSHLGPYGDSIEEMDTHLGKLMDHLTQNKLDANTLIILTSDTGPGTVGSTGNLRGRMGDGFEGGFRIPLIMHWPKKIPSRTQITRPAMNTDILPSLFDVAGLLPLWDRIIDGTSLWPLIKDEPILPHPSFYYYNGNELMGMVKGKLKYLQYPEPALYNLGLDPREQYNLVGHNPHIQKDFQARLAQWKQDLIENPRGWQKQ